MTDVKPRARNYCLDFIKGIACICVVFMHCEFPGQLGVIVQAVARFCVPFFFMVSGYFCFRPGKTADYPKKIKHIAIITLGAVIFYLIVTPFYAKSFTFSVGRLVKFLVFNEPFYVAGQLWFLFALLYDYILFAVIEKLKLRKLAYIAIPVCFVLYVLAAQGAYLAGYTVPSLIYRNFLIEGLMFFAFGFWLHEHGEKIKLSNAVLLAVFIVCTLLCPVERRLIGRDFGVNLVTFPQVTALFLLGVRNPGIGKNSLLNQLGLTYSLYVYIIHPAVWHLLDKVYGWLRIADNTAAQYVLPVLCLIITILCAIGFLKIKGLIKNKVFVKKA